MKKDKPIKICFAASSGGHLTELNHLKKIADRYDSFLITEKVENSNSKLCEKKYYVKEINRKNKGFVVSFLFLIFKEFFIFIKERPTIVITTGALCAYPMIRIAKFFKRKVIFVESYARISDLSMTGKKSLKYSDLFLVQWKELQQKYPNTVYEGSLFGNCI